MTIRCPFCELGIPRVHIKRGPLKGDYYHSFRPVNHPAILKARALGVKVRKRGIPCILGEQEGYYAQGMYFPPHQPFVGLLKRIEEQREIST